MSSSSGQRRRNPPRNPSNSASSASASSSSQSSQSSSQRPVRSTRVKNHKNLIEDDDSDDTTSSPVSSPLKTIKTEDSKHSTKPSTSSAVSKHRLINTSVPKLDNASIEKIEMITGLSRSEAIELLESAKNNLQTAIDLFFNKTTDKTKSNKRPNESCSQEDDPIISIDDDGVRAPIPQKIEKLLDYDPYRNLCLNL